MATVVYKVGDDVSTDAIYPGRFMATVLPSETPQFCFADDKAFNAALQTKSVAPGSVIVGGQNFGLGSSREHAALIIKMNGIQAVLAKSFARIFYRNCFNNGLPAVICDTDRIEEGDEVELFINEVRIMNHTRNEALSFQPIPPIMEKILKDGGLVAHVKKYGDLKLD